MSKRTVSPFEKSLFSIFPTEIWSLQLSLLDTPSLFMFYFSFKEANNVIKANQHLFLAIRRQSKASFANLSIKYGYLDLFNYFRNLWSITINTKDISYCNSCATYGQYDMLLSLKQEMGFDWNADDVAAAASQGGFLNILKHVSGLITDIIHVVNAAARGGQLFILKWMYDHRPKFILSSVDTMFDNPSSCESAAIGGCLEIMIWLRETVQCPWNPRIPWMAAKNGHEPLLKWVIKNGCPYSCKEIIDEGSLDILIFLKETGLIPDFVKNDLTICSHVASKGKLEILKFLRANGFHWDRNTTALAASYGHFELLRWAKENGCPWDESVCAYAAGRGDIPMLKWARDNGCPWDESMMTLFAVRSDDFETLEWVRLNGCQYWDEETTSEALRRGNIEMFMWSIENGCSYSKEVCIELLKKWTHGEVAEWLVWLESFSSVH
jgi:hypothetical protein